MIHFVEENFTLQLLQSPVQEFRMALSRFDSQLVQNLFISNVNSDVFAYIYAYVIAGRMSSAVSRLLIALEPILAFVLS